MSPAIEIIDIKKFNENDPHELKRVFDRYHQRLYWCSYHITHDQQFSEDVVSTAFQNIWRLDPKTFENEHHLYSFLWSATRNLSIDNNRYEERRPAVFPGEMSADLFDEQVERDMIRADILRVLHPHIQALPEIARTILKLRYKHGMTIEQAAEALQITKKKVIYHEKAAMEQLRKKMPPEARDLLALFVLLSVISHN